ncbi:50S ribosomal protein L32e [Candidatus Woesearchaeota archaeon]|nr:50S ribosomal protein L32e [Candidatus Woesearchaeota archaeon]
MKELLDLKKSMKRKKPSFIRQDAHKKKRLGKKWRRAKGLQSKVRLNLKGYVRKVKIGYGKPKKIFGVNKSGLKPVDVNNVSDLKKIDSKTEGALIRNIGLKKKLDVLKKSIDMKISILNMRDPAEFIKEAQKRIQEKADQKKKIVKEKEEKKKEREKKVTEKEKESKEKDDLSEKVEKEEGKKEKDKVLTKKDK